MTDASISRRDLLKVSALGAAALVLPFERVARARTASRLAAGRLPAPYTVPFAVPPVAYPVPGTPQYRISQEMRHARILPDLDTMIFGYNGITPGPTIHARRGTPITVRLTNELPATHPTLRYETWTSCHLHGSASRPQFDGYASDITRPGFVKTYEYPNTQDARTLWYHDHGVHHTAENAYMGLAAQYHLHDEVEDGLPIPKWRFDGRPDTEQYDIPLTIQDKMFAADGNLLFDDDDQSALAGDVIVVNGRPWPVMRVARRKYRFRMLNASLSRGYRLQLSDRSPMTVIGTDGGLMPAPQRTTQLRIGMAERYEVVIDFSRYSRGARIDLRNLGVPNSVDYDHTDKVMRFVVTEDRFDPANDTVPPELNPSTETMGLQPADADRTTRIELVRKHGLWTINGDTWEDVVESEFRKVVATPELDEVQIWELRNSSGGWFHPLHIHLVDFKILDRNGRPPAPYERGPKDVAYIGENETVRAIMRFSRQTGRYMIHCHNLVHEDHDMMVQFRVGEDAPDNDPIRSAPPVPL